MRGKGNEVFPMQRRRFVPSLVPDVKSSKTQSTECYFGEISSVE